MAAAAAASTTPSTTASTTPPLPLTKANLVKLCGRGHLGPGTSSYLSQSRSFQTDEWPLERRLRSNKFILLCVMQDILRIRPEGTQVLRKGDIRFHRDHICPKGDCHARETDLPYWKSKVLFYEEELRLLRRAKYGTPPPPPPPPPFAIEAQQDGYDNLRQQLDFADRWPAIKQRVERWINDLQDTRPAPQLRRSRRLAGLSPEFITPLKAQRRASRQRRER